MKVKPTKWTKPEANYMINERGPSDEVTDDCNVTVEFTRLNQTDCNNEIIYEHDQTEDRLSQIECNEEDEEIDECDQGGEFAKLSQMECIEDDDMIYERGQINEQKRKSDERASKSKDECAMDYMRNGQAQQTGTVEVINE